MAQSTKYPRYKTTDQQASLRNRLPIVGGVMVVATLYLIVQLVTFQYQPAYVTSYYNRLATFNYSQNERIAAARGVVYDRAGQPLASNTLDYEIGISPNLIARGERTIVATSLAAELDMLELDVLRAIDSSDPWVLLAKPVPPEVAERVRDLDYLGVTINSQPRRLYPQGTLGAQILGFVAGDNTSLQSVRGYNGVEGYYESELAGRVRDQAVSQIPFDLPTERAIGDQGSNLVLTIDRDIQFLIESELQLAVTENGATGGTIIVMDPRTGEILGMTSYPSYDPNAFFDLNEDDLRNPAISDEYEPGSVMKVITAAAALDINAVPADFTYVDNGALQVGGITIANSDRQAKGVVSLEQMLVQSLNVGAATVSLEMGPSAFYQKMSDFGFARATGVDLEGEAIGTMFTPLDAQYSDSNLGTNSFGQGIAVTPLQMITSVSAIANGGLMMQPHVVHQVVDGNRVYPSQPSALGRPISAETAQIVTDMMVQVIEQNLPAAQVPGYTIAGKTGTAEIPTPLGYEADASIASFVGFLPADDPQVIVLIKLDRPSGYWGSVVATPVFKRVAERLVILMEIPTDDIRRSLAAAGGTVNDVWSR
jgi:cell division protein FtsI (penicillin-binding protein 3)